MSVAGIQGHLLDVTVVGCSKLKDTEWISRQDPYVYLEYASTKFRTRTCTDGGRNPTFQEKFVFNLIEGLREISVAVWNSNTLTYDDFIGSGKVQLQKVLSQGYDDSSWPLQTKTGRHAGEVRFIMHYSKADNKPSFAPSAPSYTAPTSQVPLYSMQPPGSTATHATATAPYQAPYPQPPPAYPPFSPYPSYSSVYPPSPYPPPHPNAYTPPPYPPSSVHPPPPPTYLPPPASPYYPPGPYPGVYPPPS